jgi:hypothetical protein
MKSAPAAGCGFPASGQSQPGGHNPNAPGSATTGRGQPAPSVRAAAGTDTAYAAAIAAFSYALGKPVPGPRRTWPGQHRRRICRAVCPPGRGDASASGPGGGGGEGGLLALALARPWGRIIPRRGLRAVSAAASALLIVYGALNVLAAALVLSGVLHPTGRVDRTALRWHAGVWDLWFLVWGCR